MPIKEHREIKAKRELTYDFFESNFKDVLRKNPILETKVATFLKNVSQKYEPAQANLIRRAIIIGAVAHQNNEIENKRYRKAGDNGDTKATPYFIHPIEMAETMISPTKENPTFDWITVVATLLHDVPEDVKLKGVKGKEAWLSTIEGIFKDTGYQFMLTSIIDGVTEREIPARNLNDETRKLYEHLEETPMYKMIISYIQHGGMRHKKKETNHIYSDERKRVAEVVYNLEHLFLSATQTPEELRIFLIKIADVWHNLQSPEWVKDIKVLRGRIAAGLADLLGWNLMRDKIIVSLAKITDVTTPFSPHNQKNNKTLFYQGLTPHIEQEQIENLNATRQIIPQLMNDPLPELFSIRAGFPIPHPDKKNPLFAIDGETTTLPQPEIEATIPIKLFNNLVSDYGRYRVQVRDSRNIHGTTTVAIKHNNSLISKTVNLLGRNQIDLIIKTGNRNSFTIRIKDDKPQVVDLFKTSGKSVLPNQIPEIGLLDSNFTENKDLLSTHIQALIGFCYEPNIIGQMGEGIVPVFHRKTNRLYFLPSMLSVREAGDLLGDPELKESFPGETLWDLNDTRNKSKVALRRIIKV
ncbi:MAG: hypothetical protein WC894_03460 [Patescibacteria group bacterium]